MTAAARLYGRLAPYQEVDQEQGGPLEHLAEALTVHLEIADELARDTDTHEAWHVIFDPLACPEYVLPWLAQVVGVTLLPSDTIDQQRSRIASAAGFYRGTQRAIREEVQLTLTGTKTVRVTKTGAWSIAVLTRTAETPDPDASERAAMAQKPAGVVLTYIVSDDVIWAEATLDWATVVPTITWAAVELADVT